MPTCIYCTEQDRPFTGVDHVVPEAYWPFEEPRWVLDCVCDECNGHFGRGVEQSMARDSVEAVLRAIFGLKFKERGKRLGGRRLDIAVTEASDWGGAQVFVERDLKGKNCTFRLQPAVLIRKKDDIEWERFFEQDLDCEALRSYLPDPEVRVFGPTEEETRRIQEKVAEFGIKPKGWTYENRAGSASLFLDSECDDTILRVVAKIAFNFLAYIHGAGFALESDFDGIRNYIWKGARGPSPPVHVQIPRGGANRLRPRHAIVLTWDMQNRAILCSVTLFGYLLYQVTLCKNYCRPWRPLGAGRIFDLQSKSIREIPGLNLWPPDAWVHQFWDDSIES